MTEASPPFALAGVQEGVAYQSRGNVALDMDTIKILKSQDANYIRTQLAIEESQVERTKAQLEQLTDLLPSKGAAGGDDEEVDEALEENLRKAEEETLVASGLMMGGKGKGKEVKPRKVKKTVFVDSLNERESSRQACEPERDELR